MRANNKRKVKNSLAVKKTYEKKAIKSYKKPFTKKKKKKTHIL